tara:strand:- start:949 stop:1686 length:738 start_codon:yes stop_codon:yes gene_type:complete
MLINDDNKKYKIEYYLKHKTIPKIIHITYKSYDSIPLKVWNLLKLFAYDYKIIFYADEDCVRILNEQFSPAYVRVFNSLITGAHRADFFRYCILYKLGGIYLDVKIEPLIDLNTIFNHKLENTLYTVISGVSNDKNKYIFQGIIASYPNNSIFLDLISDFFRYTHHHRDYMFFTKKFYELLEKKIKKKLIAGDNKYENQNVVLFIEKNIKTDIDTKTDRHKGFWNIFDKNDKHIFKTRYNDFPWK